MDARRGKTRLEGHPLATRIALQEADAENLPFGDESFDAVTIGFGLRNVTNRTARSGKSGASSSRAGGSSSSSSRGPSPPS